jgi:hypothetical protein
MQMEFKKGDGQTHYFSLPEESWTPGGTLWFAAKPIPDNDATDAAAVIDKSFDDTTIVDSDHEEYAAGFVTYQLEFLPGDITGVNFNNGESSLEYLGEFQFVPDTGIPESFPPNNEYINVIIYADIKRGTS